jgi:hypothetical protein
MVGRRRSGAAIAGGRIDDDARRVGVEEGELDRVGIRVGAAGNREVDHVDTVDDCLVDGCDRVGAEASLRETDPVHDDVGARRHTTDVAAVDAE